MTVTEIKVRVDLTDLADIGPVQVIHGGIGKHPLRLRYAEVVWIPGAPTGTVSIRGSVLTNSGTVNNRYTYPVGVLDPWGQLPELCARIMRTAEMGRYDPVLT